MTENPDKTPPQTIEQRHDAWGLPVARIIPPTIVAARSSADNPMPLCECQGCDWVGPMNQLDGQFDEISDLLERVALGETLPVGTCHQCGSLCHFLKTQPSAETLGVALAETLFNRITLASLLSPDGEFSRFSALLTAIYNLTERLPSVKKPKP